VCVCHRARETQTLKTCAETELHPNKTKKKVSSSVPARRLGRISACCFIHLMGGNAGARIRCLLSTSPGRAGAFAGWVSERVGGLVRSSLSLS
jgi:hypothetical protein